VLITQKSFIHLFMVRLCTCHNK